MPTDSSNVSLSRLEAMRPGARNAVRVCMRVTRRDRVFIITDRLTYGIGRLLCEEASNVAAQVHLRDLEQYGPRPIVSLPESLRAELLETKPTVTFYAASTRPGEITFRTGLRVFLLNDLNVRHAHMPGITSDLMQQGMGIDYRHVAEVTRSVYARARLASTCHVTSVYGTDLTATFDPALRWVPCTGLYHRAGQWGNLPEGEVFTCPGQVDGQLVVHILGDYFSGHGVLPSPITLRIQESRLQDISCADQALATDFGAYLDSAENGRRVGEFAIGTNIGLKKPVGNLLQDEKLPGVHVAFGNPYPHQTGALWASPLHIDVIPLQCTVRLDDEVIITAGEFDYDLLRLANRTSPS